MSHEHDTLLRQAVDQGILPPAALQDRRPAANDRHWAVVLLTALGAWLALLPLLILFAFALSDWIERGAGHNAPTTIYRYDVAHRTLTVWDKPGVKPPSSQTVYL